MPLRALVNVIVGVLLLGAIVTALLRARSIERRNLHLVPPNLLALDHLCRASGTMLRSGPSTRRITMDLTNITYLDDSNLVSLEYWCARWAESGAQVTIDGCSDEMAGALQRRGLRADIRRQPRLA